MTHPACFSHQPGLPVSRWPALPSRVVSIGGVRLSCADAETAAGLLEAAGGAAVAQVLRAARSPLAGCDYRAAAAPFTEPPGPGPYGRGAAGFPAVRTAFIRAIREALRRAETTEPARHFAAELDAARRAFGSDAGYAAEIAAAAVAVRRREHAAALRAALAAAVSQAVAGCGARAGEFSCTAVSACGTGDCALAAGVLAGPAMSVPAPPGRLPRPANHARPGSGFGTSAALAALEAAAALDLTAAVRTVPVTGADHAVSADAPARR